MQEGILLLFGSLVAFEYQKPNEGNRHLIPFREQQRIGADIDVKVEVIEILEFGDD